MASTRKSISPAVQTKVLIESRRRCAFCFGLKADLGVKKGQIAHIDKDNQNNAYENLVWLCLDHHDDYDSKTSQSKGLTLSELRQYRDDLNQHNILVWDLLQSSASTTQLSDEEFAIAKYLAEHSEDGRKCDPMVRASDLCLALGLSSEVLEMACDALCEFGLIEPLDDDNTICPLNRLFWEIDPIVFEYDPSVDALEVAKVLVLNDGVGMRLPELAVELYWGPRRLNPSVSFLQHGGHIVGLGGLGTAPFERAEVRGTVKTKRFVKDFEAL